MLYKLPNNFNRLVKRYAFVYAFCDSIVWWKICWGRTRHWDATCSLKFITSIPIWTSFHRTLVRSVMSMRNGSIRTYQKWNGGKKGNQCPACLPITASNLSEMIRSHVVGSSLRGKSFKNEKIVAVWSLNCNRNAILEYLIGLYFCCCVFWIISPMSGLKLQQI